MLPFGALPWFELARFRRSRLTRAALVAVCLVPLFYGVLYVTANWDPVGNLDRVPAAIVNQDKMVTITDPSGKEQVVPLGRQLAGALISRSDDNFDWSLQSAADARKGLENGTYAAVLTIPPSFSTAATSAARASAATDGQAVVPQQARLLVQTDDAQNYLTGTIGQSVTAVATSTLNAQIAQQYVSNLYVGFGTLHDQLYKAAGGADFLADGAKNLDSGLKAQQSALSGLAAGCRASGASAAYCSQVASVAGSTSMLAAGAAGLHDGTGELADGLTTAVTKIPDLTPEQRQGLATAATTPVVAEVHRDNAVNSNGAGLAPYFMALALWVGGMAIYLLLRAVSPRALASTAGSLRVALAGFVPGAVLAVVQAFLLVLVLTLAVGVKVSWLPAVLVFAVVVALTFTAINQALVALFGGAGRFVGLILISLQLASAGGTYPIGTAPGFFGVAHDLLPMTYAVSGLRTLIAGGSGAVPALLVLFLWLGLAVGVTTFAVARRRTWTVGTLHPTLAA
ncbi:YhgE/Pip domain-containing protein [Spongisporangium articulatum]|uniref:YhgE/Pip domain-containing protein n=1 Tax=Spongisporangium articulatum TaxID=3362603 RepID=A0ABW8ALK4_9ACTN